MTKERFSFNWWKEWTIIMGVFAVTGSSTVMIVRPLLKEGTPAVRKGNKKVFCFCTNMDL
ncbi:hypothetical protein BGZ98_001289 [Dissophora globulifera]|nr:hypothetical protein BGZ98_001289 [Dissophora globulifera]